MAKDISGPDLGQKRYSAPSPEAPALCPLPKPLGNHFLSSEFVKLKRFFCGLFENINNRLEYLKLA